MRSPQLDAMRQYLDVVIEALELLDSAEIAVVVAYSNCFELTKTRKSFHGCADWEGASGLGAAAVNCEAALNFPCLHCRD